MVKDADHLVDIFDYNTQHMVLQITRHLEEYVLGSRGCIREEGDGAGLEAKALEEELASMVPGKWKGTFFSTYPSEYQGKIDMTGLQMTFQTVYHKLLPTCYNKALIDNGYQDILGETQCDRAAYVLKNAVYDISTSTENCFGESCASAAEAVDGYNELLNIITPMRSNFALIWTGMMIGGKVYRDESCRTIGDIIEGLREIVSKLPAVVAKLKANTKMLMSSCIIGDTGVNDGSFRSLLARTGSGGAGGDNDVKTWVMKYDLQYVDMLKAQAPAGGPSCCADSCDWANNGFCDDGGDGSSHSACDLGTDCTDCGNRCASPPPPGVAARMDNHSSGYIEEEYYYDDYPTSKEGATYFSQTELEMQFGPGRVLPDPPLRQ
jgi:hypothetical protein